MRVARAVVSVVLLLAVAAYLFRTGVVEVPVGLRLPHILFAAVFLFANAVLAGWRLSVLARFEGHPLTLRTALKANAAGAALSQVMINFLGQAAGRIAIMRRANIPADATITISVVERLAATVVLTGMAVGATLFLFGKISFGQEIRPGYILQAGFGLVVSTLLAGIFVYRGALLDIARQLKLGKAGNGFLVTAGISLIVHGAMLAAYLTLASAFAEDATLIDLVAAGLIVMFTASLPISFGGWGVREFSAAAVLPIAGLTVTQSVFVALLIGVGSLIVHLPIWFAVSAPRQKDSVAVQATNNGRETAVKAGYVFSSWLGVLVPILVSVAIIFNLHLPIAGGVLNVNLADPLVIIGGALFLAYWLDHGSLPQWRVPALNVFAVLASLVLILAALVGLVEIGFSAWAFRNRLGGWLILLAYAATGALIVLLKGDDGRRMLLKGFVAGLAPVAAMGLFWRAYNVVGATFLGNSMPQRIEGFSQNSNAFSFLLVAGLSVIIALFRTRESRAANRILVLVATIFGAALVLTGSRAGSVALALICVVALMIDWRLLKPMLKAGAFGTALILFLVYVPTFDFVGSGSGDAINVFSLGKSPSGYTASDSERWRSIEGGIRLWQENPFFGAGLGVFFEETTRTGVPLVVHNTLLWLLAETGLFGFAVFFVIGVTIFWVLKGRLRDPTDVGATTMFLFLLAFAAMSMVHELLYQRVLWFALGICLASVPTSRRNDKVG